MLVRRIELAAALAGLLAAACGGEPPPAETGKPAVAAPAELTEVWQTERDTLDNIDSPAVWHGPNGEHWLLSTAKTTDVLVVNDAATGKELRRVGGPGTGPGKLERPNGILVIDDLAMVVERDNHRVQVFQLPSFKSIGIFGDALLKKPYGIAVYPAPRSGGLHRVRDRQLRDAGRVGTSGQHAGPAGAAVPADAVRRGHHRGAGGGLRCDLGRRGAQGGRVHRGRRA